MSRFSRKQTVQAGFSLVELLIALGILGVLATFIIPGILTPQVDYTARAKSVALMVNTAYEQYKAANGGIIPRTTRMTDLMPYMQYTTQEATAYVDGYRNDPYTSGYACSASGNVVCLRMANGGILFFNRNYYMGGTTAANVVWYMYDQDGKYTSGTSKLNPSLSMFLTAEGKQYSYGNLPQTVVTWFAEPNNTISYTAASTKDPLWFTGF